MACELIKYNWFQNNRNKLKKTPSFAINYNSLEQTLKYKLIKNFIRRATSNLVFWTLMFLESVNMKNLMFRFVQNTFLAVQKL